MEAFVSKKVGVEVVEDKCNLVSPACVTPRTGALKRQQRKSKRAETGGKLQQDQALYRRRRGGKGQEDTRRMNLREGSPGKHGKQAKM